MFSGQPRRVLESGKLGNPILYPLHKVDGYLDAGGARQVVQEQRQVGGGPDGPVVFNHAFVARPVEERRNGAHSVRPGFCGVLGHRDGAPRVGGPDVHDVLYPAPGLVGRPLRYAMVLLVVQQYALAGPAGDPEAVDAGLDIELHDLSERLLADISVRGHRGYDSWEYTSVIGHGSLLNTVMGRRWAHSTTPRGAAGPPPVRMGFDSLCMSQ